MTVQNIDHPSFTIGNSPVRLRQDLQVIRIRRGLQTTHVIKDPVNLKYFEFDDHEMALIEKLDSGLAWEEICQWFDHRFPPLRLSHQSLQAMIWRLYHQGLITSVSTGQGRAIANRAVQSGWKTFAQTLSQPWAIRLGGIHPTGLIRIVSLFFGWIFSPWFVILSGLGFLAVAVIAYSQHDLISQIRPGSTEFFTRENLTSFAIVIALTKVAHEFGHAMAALRYRCECHEIGVLLLAGLPSLYCDVSDSWTLPGRWQRIVISLAGIWVEMLISAVAFLLWFLSVPGVVHSISFNVMVACSLGTVLFNANPLVRYDGYYVLMDLTGVSNLEQRCREQLTELWNRVVLGAPRMNPVDQVELPRWCLVYGLASAIYRVFLTGAIIWALHLALKPFGLSFLVWTLASAGLTIGGLRMLRNASDQVQRARQFGTPAWRIVTGTLAMAGLAAWGVMTPLPWYVLGDALVEPQDQQTVVATVAGRMLGRADAGEVVEEGHRVATLDNRENQQELQKTQSELLEQEKRLQTLVERRNQDSRAAEQIPNAEAMVEAVRYRLDLLLAEQKRLELASPQKAIVYRAPIRQEKSEQDELPNWSGSLLDRENQSAWVRAGDPVCQLGSPDHMNAIAVMAQDDLESVRVGEQVDVLLISSGETVAGEIARISGLELDERDESTIGLLLPKKTDSTGRGKLYQKWYQVEVRCPSEMPAGTMVRSRCKIRIHAGKRSFAQWFVVQFLKTIRWHA